MIADLFIKILNLSIGAVPIMAALLVLRLLFKKAVPRKVFYIAWALVFLRLMVPFSIGSDLSFFNHVPKAEVIEENIGTSVIFIENSGTKVDFPVLNHPSADNPNTDAPALTKPNTEPEKPSAPVVSVAKIDKNQILGTVWIFGTAGLLLFGIIGYFAVLKKTKFESVPYTENIRLSDFFKTPIVCGLIRPKIILPMNFDLDDDAKVKSVIAHECTHIRRGDNFWRLLASFTLYVHWFNPLVWICYDAFIRDMEVSCDEEVLGKSESDIRGEYAESLVSLSGKGTNPLYGGVLSFGESAIKERVKCIMNFKKATVFILIICLAAAVALGAIFLTNPSISHEPEEVYFEISGGDDISFSKENGLEINLSFTNTDDRTLWLSSDITVDRSKDGKGYTERFESPYGTVMVEPGKTVVFCDKVPAEYCLNEPVYGEWVIARSVFIDEEFEDSRSATFSFEVEETKETSIYKEFYGVFAAGIAYELIPDQRNLPTEELWADTRLGKYCYSIIGVLKNVNSISVVLSPSDEQTIVEMTREQAEEIMSIIKNDVNLYTTSEPYNPSTGGTITISITTLDDRIDICYDGRVLISQEGQPYVYVFSGEYCKETFDRIKEICEEAVGEPVIDEEPETNPQQGSDEGPAPVQLGEEYLIPYDTGAIAGLFCNSEKTYIPVSSATALVELRKILAYGNFINLMRVEETETSELGKALEGVDVVEFARDYDGKKYNLSLYENGFILNGSAVDEKDKGKIFIVEKEAWSNFRYIVKTMFENASFRNPYWLGLANEKNIDIIWVALNNGNFVTYNNEMDCFELLVPIIKSISVEAPATRLTEYSIEEIAQKLKGDYIRVSMNFFTDTVYDLYITETELYIDSNDMKYSLYYKLSEPGESFNELYSFAVEEEAGINPSTPEENPSTAKPVIYLYPEKETEVSVKLDFDGKLTYTYPALNNGWRVLAKPDGTLTNLADNSTHYYLFWEGTARPKWTYEKGFVVKGSETENFLRENLVKMGLTPREYNDFITYWVPKMQENKYNLISFSGAEYSEIAKLTVNPKPDTMIRIHMMWKALDEPIKIEPQVLPTYERKGFTLVEWGGTELY